MPLDTKSSEPSLLICPDFKYVIKHGTAYCANGSDEWGPVTAAGREPSGKRQNQKGEIMTRIFNRLVPVIGLFLLATLPTLAQAKPNGIKKHALAKVGMSAVKVAVAAPKAAAVGLKDTIGGVLFAAEAGVDVVHVATSALSKAASSELKHNPFVYPDKLVGYADSGLEKGYLFFFHAQI